MFSYIKRKISKFIAWMKYSPPKALSAKGWRLFRKEYKQVAPIRHWIMQDFRRLYLNRIARIYEEMTEWVRLRTIRRYHIVSTGLKPGYYDLDYKMLHINFNMLKDFVEIEHARSRYYWSDEYRNTASIFEKYMPLYHVIFPFRRPKLGILSLERAAQLDDGTSAHYAGDVLYAKIAKEVLDLYLWWTQTRPNRKHIELPSFDTQGCGMFGELDSDFNHDAPDFKAYKAASDAHAIQEDEWIVEDQEYLERLIATRKSLWI